MGIWDELISSNHYMTPEVALFNQGKLLISKRKYELAKDKLQKALIQEPAYVDARYSLALLYNNHLKNSQDAKKEASKILQVVPLHQGARSLLESLDK